MKNKLVLLLVLAVAVVLSADSAMAAVQTGPGGGSVNPPDPQQLWQIILRFLRNLFRFLFGWLF